ncbi:ATP-binding cassette domain-containing protein [Lachnospiraceae bacterium ASD3451]|uniref:ATP-binding cassette domain-containing protein n=1 Tax=Diplocloster agilis TaxID=2850323 RepID=UPI001DEB7EBA|nr:ATP-binding cassette domain-containing protein [Diplocloster agilis]MBU9744889.1 ATP-binding cassette domain-containing protein [Diplocloster agilis]
MKEFMKCSRLNRRNESERLEEVNIDLYAGEIVAFLGMNGSGVEGVLDILSGNGADYSGDVWIEGRKVRISSVFDAQRLGIFCIGRNELLVRNMSLVENIGVLDGKERYLGLIRREQVKRTAQIRLEEFHISVPIHATPNQLTEYQRHEVEILKAVYCGAKLILFTDFFAFYTKQEQRAFRNRIQGLARQGITVVLALNQFKDEWENFFDRTLLFHGGTVGMVFHRAGGIFEQHDIGGYLKNIPIETPYIGYNELIKEELTQPNRQETLLEIRDQHGRLIRSFSRGSSFGVLNSAKQLPETFKGLSDYLGSGIEISFRGRKLSGMTDKEIHKMRIALVQCRYTQSPVIENLSVMENICLYARARYRRMGIICRRVERYLIAQALDGFDYLNDIRPYLHCQNCYGLQKRTLMKIMIARFMALEPELAVFFVPFPFSDVYDMEQQKAFIRQQICRGDRIVILISDELEFLTETVGEILYPIRET